MYLCNIVLFDFRGESYAHSPLRWFVCLIGNIELAKIKAENCSVPEPNDVAIINADGSRLKGG